MLLSELNEPFQQTVRRPECPNAAEGGGHTQWLRGGKSCLEGQANNHAHCILAKSVTVFFLHLQNLSEAELKGEETSALR